MDCAPECGNQLIMALSYTQKTSDNSLITKYVRKTLFYFLPSWSLYDACGQQSLYDQFATYLTQKGLYMESQFSADNFNGQLANQTNLAVKVCLVSDVPCRYPQLTMSMSV